MTHRKYFYPLIKANYTEFKFCLEEYLIEILKDEKIQQTGLK